MALLGSRADTLTSFFGDLADFRAHLHAPGPPKLIAHGKSGAVFTLRNVKGAKRLVSALKVTLMSEQKNPDNLLFEACVGKLVVNDFCRRFPLFVRTFNLYHLRDRSTLDALLPPPPRAARGGGGGAGGFSRELLDGNELDVLSDADMATRLSCAAPTRLALHLEYVADAVSLEAHLDEALRTTVGTRNFWAVDCAAVLFQLYAPLAVLEREFTHYDLHLGNILLWRLPPRQFVRMHYHYPASAGKEDVVLQTHLVTKIIDYGRCFTRQSESIRARLCRLCGADCGRAKGHVFINYSVEEAARKETYITPQVANRSHDLRAAFLVRALGMDEDDTRTAQREKQQQQQQQRPPPDPRAVAAAVAARKRQQGWDADPATRDMRALLRTVEYLYVFGTPENPRNSVATFAERLRMHISRPDARAATEQLRRARGRTVCIGTVHVYLSADGGEMRFEPSGEKEQ